MATYQEWIVHDWPQHFPSLPKPDLDLRPTEKDSKLEHVAYEILSEGAVAATEEAKARGRELTRDEALAASVAAMKAFQQDELRFKYLCKGSGEAVQHALEASRDPRPRQDRAALRADDTEGAE